MVQISFTLFYSHRRSLHTPIFGRKIAVGTRWILMFFFEQLNSHIDVYILFLINEFLFSHRMSTTKWSCARRKVSCHSSNWTAKRLPTRPSSSRNCHKSSKKNWTRRWRKSNATFRTQWFRWLKITWCGFCSGGAPNIRISCWKVTRSICRMRSASEFPTAFWTFSSDSHTDAR